ncbi:hypothetical protein QQF64_026308, partial [Cirrhinus molitorella]
QRKSSKFTYPSNVLFSGPIWQHCTRVKHSSDHNSSLLQLLQEETDVFFCFL